MLALDNVIASMGLGPYGAPRGTIAFGHSLDAYEAILARMCGLEDGQTDGLFQFTRPVTGLTAWCPPLRADGRLDLSAIRA